MRKSGILLPISTLPSKYGIGTFSKEAYHFVDFLKKSGQSLWQILPLGPTGYGDSPYQSFSTFAGNPYYIDLEALQECGYLTKKDCKLAERHSKKEYVDYEKIYETRFVILKAAYKNACEQGIEKDLNYRSYKEINRNWINDYALYMAVKATFEQKSWIEWDEDIRLREEEAMQRYSNKYANEVEFYIFLQYLFFVQWKKLKAYANKQGIEIIGDIPIYVAFDSADTWANPRLFQLDEKNLPVGVAGCPPDAFCETGQLWGNPLYNWEYHKETGYKWWIERMAFCYELYDIVRIDHFRGFDEYWYVPYGDETAQFGKWIKGPGYELFEKIEAALGKRKVIAEDLGFLTDSVIELVKKTGYPGMKILQFAFGTDENNDYLPHNYEKNCIVYTGTHDNETILGWYKNTDMQSRKNAKAYLGIKNSKEIEWAFIRLALSSVADIAIIPLQDYLGIGEEGRINMPSTLGGNWQWRMEENCSEQLSEKIYQFTKMYGRL